MSDDPSHEPSRQSAQPVHVPVLCDEIMDLAAIQPGESWLDGTAGGGGHSRLIADRIGPEGRLLSVDRDPEAVAKLQCVMPSQARVMCSSYHDAGECLEELGIEPLDGVLLDLGLSSDQLADRERGFSYQGNGELDMRFNPEEGQPVWQWLHRADEKTIADTIYQWGEERFSRRIARRIVETRRKEPVKTVEQLRELIYRAIPGARRATTGNRKHGRVDPATRTFQALRIAVNDELGILTSALERLPDYMAIGGRLMIISFHSLEDRIVKHAFREDPRLQIVTKKPITASDAEIAKNPRSRSAKLRVATRIEPESEPMGNYP